MAQGKYEYGVRFENRKTPHRRLDSKKDAIAFVKDQIQEKLVIVRRPVAPWEDDPNQK